MTCLVISGLAFLGFLDLSRFLGSTYHNLQHSCLDIVHTDERFVLSCSKQSRLVKKVGKICTGKSDSCLSDL